MRELDKDFRPVDPDRDNWKAGFDEGSSSGLSCGICGALVAHMPEYVQRHREWHERTDGR